MELEALKERAEKYECRYECGGQHLEDLDQALVLLEHALDEYVELERKWISIQSTILGWRLK